MSTCEPKQMYDGPPLNGNSRVRTDFVIYGDTNQRTLNYITPIQEKALTIQSKLDNCGKFITKHYFCRQCEAEGRNALLKVSEPVKHFCEIRYCNSPDCVVERFARTIETFKSIKELNGWNSLWHFVIGFPAITEEEFKKNFPQLKKRYEYVMTSFFSKLRKKGFNIPAIRVLDFSFVSEGMVFPHYHFGAMPVKKNQLRMYMNEIKTLEKSMNKNMKIKTNFHFQSLGYRKKSAIFSYLSKRAVGLYKYNEDKNLTYNTGKGKLKQDIIDKKYFHLSDLISIEQFVEFFYNKQHYATIGGLPHGSILTDNSESEFPSKCPIHGDLEKADVRFESVDYIMPKPPDIIINVYPEQPIELIKIPTIKSTEVYK